jgi:hypothetical protein
LIVTKKKEHTSGMHVVAAEEAVGLQAVLEGRRHRYKVVAGGVVAAVHDLKGWRIQKLVSDAVT